MKKIIIPLSLFFLSMCVYLVYSSSHPLPKYVAEKIEQFDQTQKVEVVPLLFVGDVMLGRYVEVLQKRGLDPFGDTTSFLKSHTTIVNLEGPIPKLHIPTKSYGFSFSFPEGSAGYLKKHGVSAVSLSNNHMLDQGSKGYEDTKNILEKEGIFHFGGYDSDTSDYYETQLGSKKVIITGVNMISSTWNEKTVIDRIHLIHMMYPDAFLVVYIHWGNEYKLTQSPLQEVFAHKLIDTGVNAIIGSHPHVVEGIEIYKNSPIFYSLGNFIFDQYFSEETQEGYMVSVYLQKNYFVYTLIPVVSKKSKVSIPDAIISEKIRTIIMKSSTRDLQKSINDGVISIPSL